jgi:HEAT repeat protein
VNKNAAENLGLILKAVRWETDSYPGFHIDGPQGLIDPIINIEDCDILICIFWKRFGTITKDGKTGTEHEFYKAYEAWKQNKRPHIMMYFNQKEYFPRNTEEAKQQLYVFEFKEKLPKEGLHWDYNGIEQFKEYVYDHITKYLQDHFNKKSVPQINQSSIITTISNQEIEKILDNYKNSLEKKVSKIRLLGDNKEYDLTEVFVDLIITEQYERPSFSVKSLDEYKGMMDYELRKKRILFSDYYQKENNNKNKEGKDNKEKIIKKIKPDDLLKSNKKTTIIVGAPGSGKTTLLKYLVHKTLQDQECFSIYLELKGIQRQNFIDTDRFEDIVFYEAIISPLGINDKEEQKNIHKKLRDKLNDGKIAFFLDGLDEMRTIDNDHHTISLRDLFNKFIRMDIIHNNLVIVTTRPYALKERYEQVQEMEIASFNMEQIKQFINHYYSKDNHHVTKNFLKDLSIRTEIQELARVPLILGFLLQEYIESKSFSENKLDLYKNIVTRLNNKLDEVRGIKRSFKITYPLFRYEIIANLAFSGLFNFNEDILNRLVFTDDQILDEVKKYCYDKPELKLNPYDLVEDIKATALLREIGNGRYSFTHLTLQEYLAATILVKDENLSKLFCQAYFDPTMCEMEALPMTIGLSQSRWIGNSKVNLYELLEKLPESINFANLRLRIRGLCYSPNRLDENYLSHIVDRLIEFVHEKNIDEASYKNIIFNVFSGLSVDNTKYISKRLLELLREHHQLGWSISIQNLIYVLGKLKDKEAIPGLVELLKDEVSSVRRDAASALRGTQDKEAVSRMIELLKDDELYVRRAAASALTGTQDKEAISGLVELLKDNENSDVCSVAAYALTGTQDKEAISGLVDLLKDYDKYVRRAAASALTGTQDKEAISKLVELLKDENSSVRRDAASALTRTKDKEAISGLVELLKYDENSDVRSAAAYALTRTKDKEAVSRMVELLKDENSSVRRDAASALTRTKDKEAVSKLVELLKDENSSVRRAAAYALTGTQDKEAISGLVNLLKDDESYVRRTAASALTGIQDKEAISGLVNLLKDDESYVRRTAASALESYDLPILSKGLLMSLSSDNRFVKRKSISVIGYYSNEEAKSKLEEIIKNDLNEEIKNVAKTDLEKLQFKIQILS